MIPKFSSLQTKGQILALFRQYPNLVLAVPKKGQAVFINSPINGLIKVSWSIEKSTDNKRLYCVECYL